jgi:hypothetical protein
MQLCLTPTGPKFVYTPDLPFRDETEFDDANAHTEQVKLPGKLSDTIPRHPTSANFHLVA